MCVCDHVRLAFLNKQRAPIPPSHPHPALPYTQSQEPSQEQPYAKHSPRPARESQPWEGTALTSEGATCKKYLPNYPECAGLLCKKKKSSPFAFTAQKSTLCYDPSSGYLRDFASPSTLCFHRFFSFPHLLSRAFIFFPLLPLLSFHGTFVPTEKKCKEDCFHTRNSRHALAHPHTCMHAHSLECATTQAHTYSHAHPYKYTNAHTALLLSLYTFFRRASLFTEAGWRVWILSADLLVLALLS